MPFEDKFFEVYEMLKRQFEKEFIFSHAGDEDNQQNILKDIIQAIYEADIIIADLTGLNANVFYELGVAHTLNKKVIIITENIPSLPFDLKSYRAKEYSTHFTKFAELIEALDKYLHGAISGEVTYSNPVNDFLSTQKKADIVNSIYTNNSEIELPEDTEKGFLDFMAGIEDNMEQMTNYVNQMTDDLQVNLLTKQHLPYILKVQVEIRCIPTLPNSRLSVMYWHRLWGRRKAVFYVKEKNMDLFIYSDESGVFDKAHNEIFVYGGLIFVGKQQKDEYVWRYLTAEKTIRGEKYSNESELKACRITNKEKGKLYRSLGGAIKFGVIVNQKNVLDRIFLSKKDKQRYLDYAYKIGLKRALKKLIAEGLIGEDVDNIFMYNDEHSTATNGRYELREGLEQEFKLGTYNMRYDKFFPPLFETMQGVCLEFCDSKKVTLIRAADIVANRIYFMALNRKLENLSGIFISSLP